MSSNNYSPRLYPGVMISSTFTDLEQHRAALIKAVKGQGLTDVAMENDSAKADVDVIESSLQMVRDASAYILLISHKYGQTPVSPDRNPQKLSITELEFNEAQLLKRPTLLFIMAENHPLTKKDVESNATKEKKLNAFRERAKKMGPDSQVHRVYATFDSLQDFTSKAIQAVAELRRYLDKAATISPPASVHPSPAPAPAIQIPLELPPAAKEFVGRQLELQRLIQRLLSRKNTAVVGPAGMGKTALAAQALRTVVGDTSKSLAESPYPDGVVYLDLYAMRGAIETTWETLANKLEGPNFMKLTPARERATSACHGRNLLIIIEGGEEADGQNGRSTITELLSVMSVQNRYLLLTRLKTQTIPADSVILEDSLSHEDASQLFDSLTQNRVKAKVGQKTLDLLAGHPLALTWAGNLLAIGDESPEYLVADWSAKQLPSLSDPKDAEHTLEWLFNRSVRGLDETATRALAAAGLLAHAPFPVQAIDTALHERPDKAATRQALRSLVQRGLLRVTDDDRRQFTHVLGYRFARKERESDPELRTRLGAWLYDELTRALKVGDPSSVIPLLEHLAALLRADGDQSLWEPLAQKTLYQFRGRLTNLGRLGQVRLALDAVAAWFDRFPPDKLEESYWLRERSVLLNRQGHVLKEQGNLAGAKESYQYSLETIQRLAASEPSNTGWQRDLSVGYINVGEVREAQGDLAGAKESYQYSLETIQRLAASDPSNLEWQHGLYVSHINVGDVLRAQGDLDGAKESYEQALELIQSVAASNPSNAEWQRDLSLSHNRVGNVLLEQGDLAGALVSYQQSLEVSRRLAEADPSNAVWWRDLSYSLTRMAEILEQQGKWAQALKFAQESLKIDERLSALDPTNATWQKDVKFSRILVARLQGQSNSP